MDKYLILFDNFDLIYLIIWWCYKSIEYYLSIFSSSYLRASLYFYEIFC